MKDYNRYIQVLDVVDDDFINYKKTSMLIAMPRCDFKCNKEAKACVCQNYELRNNEIKTINKHQLLQRHYFSNPYSKAIIFAGLEPMDNTHIFKDNISYPPLETEIYEKYNFFHKDEGEWIFMSSYTNMIDLILLLRRDYDCTDDIVIYTGYTADELINMTDKHGSILPLLEISMLYKGDIIIKYGRYREWEDDKRNSSYFNELLGVELATSNQYAIRYSNGAIAEFCGSDVTLAEVNKKILSGHDLYHIKFNVHK